VQHQAPPSHWGRLSKRLTAILNPLFALDRAGAAAIVVLTAWVLIVFRDALVGHMAFTGVWALAVGGFFAGFAVAGRTPAPQPLRVGALLGVLLGLAAGSGVVARLVLDASWLQVGAITGLMTCSFLPGIFARVVWPRVASPTLVLAVEVVALWVLLDVLVVLDGVGLYDFQVYLGSAARFVAGDNPYLTAPLTEVHANPAYAGVLSAPILLPFFALLATLPWPAAATLWVILLLASAAGALRLLGMPWRWAVLFPAYPPLFPEAGNVGNLILLLLCVGPVAGGALLAGTVFKLQTGIPALWLARERRWRDLLLGLLLLLALGLVTLPLVGLNAWSDYIVGLQMRIPSQENLPILYGLSLARWMPWGAFVGLSVAAIAAALVLPGRRGLSGLGLATIVASPSLWAHGFAAAIPAILYLDAPLLWLTLGIGSLDPWFWVLPVAGAWALWRARVASVPRDALHPLSGRNGPWGPVAPE
jgi:hypothetical protein